MTRRKIEKGSETTTPQLKPYVLLALDSLGGQAPAEQASEAVIELFKGVLQPADFKLMCKTPDGEQLAPDGYTGRTWRVVVGKIHLALMHLDKEGFVHYTPEAHVLTEVGVQCVKFLKVVMAHNDERRERDKQALIDLIEGL